MFVVKINQCCVMQQQEVWSQLNLIKESCDVKIDCHVFAADSRDPRSRLEYGTILQEKTTNPAKLVVNQPYFLVWDATATNKSKFSVNDYRNCVSFEGKYQGNLDYIAVVVSKGVNAQTQEIDYCLLAPTKFAAKGKFDYSQWCPRRDGMAITESGIFFPDKKIIQFGPGKALENVGYESLVYDHPTQEDLICLVYEGDLHDYSYNEVGGDEESWIIPPSILKQIENKKLIAAGEITLTVN